METSAQHVGCSEAINSGMCSASTLAKINKENFPNRQTTLGHKDMSKGKVNPKINSAHTEQTAIILCLIQA